MRSLILEALKSQIQGDIQVQSGIVSRAQEAATHEELQAEGKYDTQGIEAGYLAGAQAKRLQELQAEWTQFQILEKIPDLENSKTVRVGSIVVTETEARKVIFFISNVRGGSTVSLSREEDVSVISPLSPLGKQLMGLEVGDAAELTTPKGVRTYDITLIK